MAWTKRGPFLWLLGLALANHKLECLVLFVGLKRGFALLPCLLGVSWQGLGNRRKLQGQELGFSSAS